MEKYGKAFFATTDRQDFFLFVNLINRFEILEAWLIATDRAERRWKDLLYEQSSSFFEESDTTSPKHNIVFTQKV